MYYLLVFVAISLLSVGILLLKIPFFSFASATAVLLNNMLNLEDEEKIRQKNLIQSLGRLLPRFGFLILSLVVVLVVSVIPVVIYMRIKSLTTDDLDLQSFYFFLSMILGSVVLFIYPIFRKKEDYSGWAKLLHRMILDNYHISKALFRVERRVFRKKIQKRDKDFVIVTGLARGGTTALTNLLYETGRFYSLGYNNMPFLLAVNLWGKIYRPRKKKLKERAHGDNLLFGYNTIEALEEYFFKVFLNDVFIMPDKLIEHEVDTNTLTNYLTYQKLIAPRFNEATYLAKNNNLILRYRALRKMAPGFKIILIFRKPVDHAYSLMNQHIRFSKQQREDPFVLEYMNWLGHHEFGLNHKAFDLSPAIEKKFFDTASIDYWMVSWIQYYSYVLSILEDQNLYLVEYSDLCSHPKAMLSTLGEKLGIHLSVEERNPYKERMTPELKVNPGLLEKSLHIYNSLKRKKVEIHSNLTDSN